MKRVDGVILEGEKLGLEKYAGKDSKMLVDLHLLTGFESLKLRVKDNNLVKQLEELPNRKPVRVKASVTTFKDDLYLMATGIIQ